MKWCQVSRFGMKLALGQIKGTKKLLGLDIGHISTGVAISDTLLQKSYLLKIIKEESNSAIFIKKLKQIITKEENIKGVIIGKPIYHSEVDIMNKTVEKLAEVLQQQGDNQQKITQTKLMFCFQDESWTTKQAKYKLHQIKKAYQYHGHIHGQKELEDGIAAMKILQRFLQYYNNVNVNN